MIIFSIDIEKIFCPSSTNAFWKKTKRFYSILTKKFIISFKALHNENRGKILKQ